MKSSPFEAEFGSEQAAGVVFGHALLGGVSVPLMADLFLPSFDQRPAPMLIWLGAAGARPGGIGPSGHHLLAQRLTREGIALAIPGCRFGAEEKDVTASVIEGFSSVEEHRQTAALSQFSSFAALAAMEDTAAFLRWITAERVRLGLSMPAVLAGASLGAVAALNTAVAAQRIGLECPIPAGVIAYSGACAWPELYVPGQFPVFALHNPSDRQVGIGSVRAMARTDPAFELIEAMEQAHGSVEVSPGEPLEDVCQRIIGLVRRWQQSP